MVRYNPKTGRIRVGAPRNYAQMRSMVDVMGHEKGHAAIGEVAPNLAKDIMGGAEFGKDIDTKKIRNYFMQKYGGEGDDEEAAAAALDETLAGSLKSKEDQDVLEEIQKLQEAVGEKAGMAFAGYSPADELAYTRRSMGQKTLYTDAGYREGKAGGGAVLLDEAGNTISEVSRRLQAGDSMSAEYKALVMGLKEALKNSAKDLLVKSDSQVMVKQLNNEFQVRNQQLKGLKAQVDALRSGFDSLDFTHIPREQNKRADALATQAILGNRRAGGFVPGSDEDPRMGIAWRMGIGRNKPVAQLEELMQSGAFKVSAAPFGLRGLTKERSLDYLNKGYAVGMSGGSNVYMSPYVINAYKEAADPKLKQQYAKAIMQTYEHEKTHTDINTSPQELKNRFKEIAMSNKVVDAFIDEALQSTSKDVYEKQFQSAQRRAKEKLGDYHKSQAARWEALQEIIAGHPEMQSARKHSSEIQKLKRSFYDQKAAMTGSAFAPSGTGGGEPPIDEPGFFSKAWEAVKQPFEPGTRANEIYRMLRIPAIAGLGLYGGVKGHKLVTGTLKSDLGSVAKKFPSFFENAKFEPGMTVSEALKGLGAQKAKTNKGPLPLVELILRDEAKKYKDVFGKHFAKLFDKPSQWVKERRFPVSEFLTSGGVDKYLPKIFGGLSGLGALATSTALIPSDKYRHPYYGRNCCCCYVNERSV